MNSTIKIECGTQKQFIAEFFTGGGVSVYDKDMNFLSNGSLCSSSTTHVIDIYAVNKKHFEKYLGREIKSKGFGIKITKEDANKIRDFFKKLFSDVVEGILNGEILLVFSKKNHYPLEMENIDFYSVYEIFPELQERMGYGSRYLNISPCSDFYELVCKKLTHEGKFKLTDLIKVRPPEVNQELEKTLNEALEKASWNGESDDSGLSNHKEDLISNKEYVLKVLSMDDFEKYIEPNLVEDF